MFYGEIFEVKFLGNGEELISELCYKKLKLIEEVYVFFYQGSVNVYRIQQKIGNDWVFLIIIDVRGRSYFQKDKIKIIDLLKFVYDEIFDNRLDVIEFVNL